MSSVLSFYVTLALACLSVLYHVTPINATPLPMSSNQPARIPSPPATTPVTSFQNVLPLDIAQITEDGKKEFNDYRLHFPNDWDHQRGSNWYTHTAILVPKQNGQWILGRSRHVYVICSNQSDEFHSFKMTMHSHKTFIPYSNEQIRGHSEIFQFNSGSQNCLVVDYVPEGSARNLDTNRPRSVPIQQANNRPQMPFNSFGSTHSFGAQAF
ncbi:hypothetical protein BDF22DRAFT_741886 [Syncephalis plumigaleata]|nr:hypothetical protein BDF22DRAFT_741886 [Syncephalis plumigaleata]